MSVFFAERERDGRHPRWAALFSALPLIQTLPAMQSGTSHLCQKGELGRRRPNWRRLKSTMITVLQNPPEEALAVRYLSVRWGLSLS